MNTPQRTATPAAPRKASAAPLRPAPQPTPFFAAAPRPAVAPATTKVAAPAPKAAVNGLAGMLPDVVREKLSERAHRFPGYALLTVLLGVDPVTGRDVPRTAANLAHGVLSLVPGGEQRYQQLQESGALARAAAWLSGEAERRNLSWARVRQLLRQAWDDFSFTDFLLHPIDTITNLVRPFRQLAADVLGFAGAVVGQVVEFIFSAVLGDKGAEVLGVLRRAGALFGAILRDPLPFLKNLVQAGWQGFKNFLAHGPQHLLAAAKDWLLGGLAKTGLHLPARLDVAGIISLLLQVFNLTKQAILGRLRQRLEQVLGAENVARVEEVLTQIGGVAVALWQHGPAAAWQQISQQAGDLKEQALEMVQQQVMGVATRAVPVFLATLAVPGGAFVQAAKGIYSAVMLFIEKGKQIAQVGSALLNAVGQIAAGQLGPAAQAVETTLVRLLPVALGFLAKWLNLDGISSAIQAGLKKVQAPVERAVNKVLDWVTDKAKALWAKLQAGVGAAVDKGKQVVRGIKGFFGIRTPVEGDVRGRHHLSFQRRNGEVNLLIESTPQAIESFLLEYERQHAVQPNTDTGRALANVRTHLRKYQAHYTQLAQFADPDVAAAGPIHQALLGLNDELSQLLKKLFELGSANPNANTPTSPLATSMEQYKLEGLTGRYSNRPQLKGDILTYDHQPQARTLHIAARVTDQNGQRLFPIGSPLSNRTPNEGAIHGYAINLSVYRHGQGRTFKRANLANAFQVEAEKIAKNSNLLPAIKRSQIVDLLVAELHADIAQMLDVVSPARYTDTKVWEDVDKATTGLSASAIQQIKSDIADRIRQGERELKNQPMDELRKDH